MIFKLSFIESGEAQTAATIFSFNLQVFKTSASSKPDKAKDVAESILSYFPGFDAFKLPPPSSDPEVVLNLNRDEVQQDINKSFVRGVEEFKANLKSKLAPKLSFSEGEIVTGEGMLRGGGEVSLRKSFRFSSPASMTSRLASVTFKMASKVFIEETDKNFEFITEILFRCLAPGDFLS